MNQALLQAYIPSMATMILVAIGILTNNNRIGDLNTRIGDLNKRIDDLGVNLNKRIDDLRADTNRQFAELREQYSRLEHVIVGKLDEFETRLGGPKA